MPNMRPILNPLCNHPPGHIERQGNQRDIQPHWKPLNSLCIKSQPQNSTKDRNYKDCFSTTNIGDFYKLNP